MKIKTLLALMLLAGISTFTNAQSLKTWTWDDYKMKFKVPDDMTVRANSGDKFEASNGSITIDIYPRKGENLTYNGMKNAIIKWADQEDLYYKTYNSSGEEQPIYMKSLNGYWGCAIDGSKSGNGASMLLLVDPDYPDISFYIWISYQDSYYHDVVQILKSFQPI
jgi:hypothetical protein